MKELEKMNSERLRECTQLAGEILKNFELSEIPMKNIILKCLRLCRLLDDDIGIKLFQYESGGYPVKDGKMLDDSWEISKIAGRRFFLKDKDTSEIKERVHLKLIPQLEALINANMERMKSAKDPDSYSGDLTPLAISYIKNTSERTLTVKEIGESTELIESIKGNLYNYILKLYNQLHYGNVIEDIFTSDRKSINEQLSNLCPEAIKKFVSIYENIDSGNPEDWANAVHSCRRIIKEIADKLYPPLREGNC